MKLSGLDVYLTFVALKGHFSTLNYDYFKYNATLKNHDEGTYANDVSAQEKALYEKLGRKYPSQMALENFLVANILMNRKQLVVSDLNRLEATKNYNGWLGRTQALGYTLTTDIRYLLDRAKGDSRAQRFGYLFEVDERQHPLILRALLSSNISIESFLILDFYAKFFSLLDERLPEDVIWAKVKFRSDKYRPFLNRIIIDAKPLKKKLHEALAS